MTGLVATVLALLLVGGAIAAAEWAGPEIAGVRRARRRFGSADAGWLALYLGYAPFAAAATAAAVAALSPLGPARHAVALAPSWCQWLGALVVADLAAYWLHRAMHAIPAMWRVHCVHHGARDVHWRTTFRFHPVDGVLAHALPLLVAAACGFGLRSLSVYVAAMLVVTVFAHADVWLPGGPAGSLIVLPRFHRSHHEIGGDRSNFAVLLPVWDAVFGTARFAAPASRRFGVDGQCRIANPIASEVTLATALTSSAVGAAGPRRHVNAASR